MSVVAPNRAVAQSAAIPSGLLCQCRVASAARRRLPASACHRLSGSHASRSLQPGVAISDWVLDIIADRLLDDLAKSL